jgi:hypothetical protein
MAILGIHNETSYERQKFSWLTAQQNNQLRLTGVVQKLCSRSCSPQRGGFIGPLQALTHTLDAITTTNTTPRNTTIIICSQDRKLLNALHKCRQPIKSAMTMLANKQGLLEEITPLLQQFRNYKTHHSTKKDRPYSTEKFTIDKCIANVQNCSCPVFTK